MDAGDGITQTIRVQMPINTLLHLILMHQVDNLSTAKTREDRRIMQETVNLLCALRLRGLKGMFQPEQLPPEDLLVVAFLEIFLVKPTACSTNTNIIINETIIKEEINIFYLIFFKKSFHLLYRTPPEVMIALSDDLFPGKSDKI